MNDIDFSKSIETSQYLVFEVHYQYTDYEIKRRVDRVQYCKDMEEVILFLSDCKEEIKIVDGEAYDCRRDIKITAKQVFLSVRKYSQLFKI